MEITLNVEVREGKGTKKVLSSLRAGSKVPAVVYGGEKPPITVSLAERDIVDARKKGGVNAVLHLKLADGVEVLDAADAVVVHCAVAKEIEIAAPVAAVPAEGAAAAVEPESSNTKGKKDEEGKLVKEAAKPGAAPAAGDKKDAAKK